MFSVANLWLILHAKSVSEPDDRIVNLILSFVLKRAYHGDWMDSIPSRFVAELPDNNIEKNEKNLNNYTEGKFNTI